MSIELTSSTEEVEQLELFAIDGKSYFIANKPRLNVALKTLKLARDKGEDAAFLYLLETAVGPEGYEALMAYDDLDADTLAKIVEAAQKVIFGGLETPKGS